MQAAGGFVIQAMPGATDELIAQLENRVARTRPVSDLIRNGATPHEIIQEVVGEFAPSVVGEQDVQFVCRCSQERVLGALVALGLDEIQDLLATKGQADVTCEFCNRQFIIDRASLEQLIVENGAE